MRMLCYAYCIHDIDYINRRYRHHQFILVSTDVDSHLLELPETHQRTSVSRSSDLIDLELHVPTLAVANVLDRTVSSEGKSAYISGSHIVQVTRDVVHLLDARTGIREDQWLPEKGRQIVRADTSPSQICIALSGGLVILLNISGDKISEKRYRHSIHSKAQAQRVFKP